MKLEYSKVSQDENTTESKSRHTDKAAGCLITWADLPNIIESFACFFCFIIYGASNGSLGAGLPALASHFHKTEARFGYVFTSRGIGYSVGTLASAAIVDVSFVRNYKVLLSCLSTLLAGLLTGTVAITSDYNTVLVIFFLQGIAFGMINTFANCVLPEIWGARIGPWMQGLHSCFGIGAIVGPAIVGNIGYMRGFTLMSFISVGPLALALIDILKYCCCSRIEVNIAEQKTIAAADDSTCDSDTFRESNGSSSKAKSIVLPWSIKILISSFFFAYVGIESSYGGWISTYALSVNVTSSETKAAYLVSFFWGNIALGRFLAIFISIFVSNTKMLRTQLTLCIIGSILTVLFSEQSYAAVVGLSCLYGFALSSIFPLAMTMVNDYGFVMDSQSTTLFVIGATGGDAAVPILVGLAMEAFGVRFLPYATVLFSFIMVVLYLTTHMVASSYGVITNSLEEDKDEDNVELIDHYSKQPV